MTDLGLSSIALDSSAMVPYIMHTALAVLHTGRWLASLCPFLTEVTEFSGKGDIINVDFTWALGYNLVHLDTPCPCWIVVLLLAGYLTGMAPGAVFIFNK